MKRDARKFLFKTPPGTYEIRVTCPVGGMLRSTPRVRIGRWFFGKTAKAVADKKWEWAEYQVQSIGCRAEFFRGAKLLRTITGR